jgi:lantibiotic leader peptide-processing serine protease
VSTSPAPSSAWLRRPRAAAIAAIGLACATTVGATTATTAAPTLTDSAASSDGSTTSYAVLADLGADAAALAADLALSGATVTSVNPAIGLVTVQSESGNFLDGARAHSGVKIAAREGVVGQTPHDKANKDSIEKPRHMFPGNSQSRTATSKKGLSDPLDSYLWGMTMINASEAHKFEMGDTRVKVGIIDSGIDGTHPDLATNFDRQLSRNFTTDMPEIDGDCEYAGCVDPADVDDNGHGTHVAGTIAAALNGMGVSGVAPGVDIVNVRAGQDSGYFFLGPTANALTYSGDAGLDVVNMSFYVDPWLYNCQGGAPEDSPEEAAEQELIIETMTRALNYAHDQGVTLVSALGNDYQDKSHPGTDFSSPDYPGDTVRDRTINNATCFDLPVEGPHVIGVSAVGPTTRKAYYSNWTTDVASGEIEVAAPGGDYFDTPGGAPDGAASNLILSTAPLNVLQAEGAVDGNGDITPGYEAWVMKDCKIVHGRAETCGYYQYYQGTSMASPHAAGVAALIVSAHGKVEGTKGFTLDPDRTGAILMRSASDTSCPAVNPFIYPDPLGSDFTASCVGSPDFNGFYGEGIVNALRAIK